MTASRVAVIDIGKTNAKLVVFDLDARREIAVRTAPNRVVAGKPYPHFDTDALFRFLLGALAELYRDPGFDAISITAHGATIVVLDAEGELALPVLDYEYGGPEESWRDYGAVRPPFAETGSPPLPGGLNVGAQLFWQAKTFPARFSRVATILTYPQYWAWRLTGVLANEITSSAAIPTCGTRGRAIIPHWWSAWAGAKRCRRCERPTRGWDPSSRRSPPGPAFRLTCPFIAGCMIPMLRCCRICGRPRRRFRWFPPAHGSS